MAQVKTRTHVVQDHPMVRHWLECDCGTEMVTDHLRVKDFRWVYRCPECGSTAARKKLYSYWTGLYAEEGV